jgi:hypothetical protein
MSWSSRRKTNYVLGTIIFIIVFVVIPLAVYLYQKPTCTDGKQNQNEIGIDCGGSCKTLCRVEYSDPKFVWGRWSKVKSTGEYNILAYIENPNIEAGTKEITYRLKLRDSAGILLFEKTGKTSVPPNKNFAIIESGIKLNDKVPGRPIEFDFISGAVWQKMQPKELGLVSLYKTITNEDTIPRVSATLSNKTLKPISNIDVTAILYDSEGNAVSFSSTKIDTIAKESSEEVVFTWPEPFTKKIYSIEIIPKVLD